MFVKFDSREPRGPKVSAKKSAVISSTDNTESGPSHAKIPSTSKAPISMTTILNDDSQSQSGHGPSNKSYDSVTEPYKLQEASSKTVIRPSSAGRSSAKSKTGCLTCKYRKKKCDETKPVCRDCQRFNKECVWIDHQRMNGAEIERLRMRVKEQESSRKLRKRTRLSNVDIQEQYATLSPPKMPQVSPQISPLDPDGSSLHQNYHSFQNSYSPHPLSELRGSPASPANFVSPVPDPRAAFGAETLTKIGSQAGVNHVQSSSSPPMHNTGPNTNGSFASFSEIPANGFPSSPHTTLSPGAIVGTNTHLQDSMIPVEPLVEPRSPAAVLGFLKELSSFNWNPQDPGQHTRGHIEELPESHTPENEGSPGSEKGFSSGSGHVSPNFNIPHFIEQMQTMSHDFPTQYNALASSFNATFSPSPRMSLSILPELDQTGLYLYNYYSDVLSSKVSIAPNSQNESNSYQRVFLPLAQRDKGVLYGILAWAGFHLGGQWLGEGSKYAELALKHLCEDISFTEGSQTVEDRRVIINKLAAILIMCGAEICRGDVKFWSIYLQWGWKLLRANGGIMKFNNNKEEHWLISNFAYHDLLASSTSDRGTYFPNETYDRIFLDADGISSGNLNPLLGVSKPLYKVIGDISSLFFESKQIMNGYYRRSSAGFKASEVPLGSPDEVGSVQSFTDSEVSDHSKVADLLNFIRNKAHDLEIVLDNVKPNAADLEPLSDIELEWQLTTFEAFQLSCKLYLRQAILKMNPSALECQILMNDLTKCLDVLIDTPMQATLVFPTFIAGLFTVTDSGKVAMRSRFEKLINTYGPWNVVRVKSLVEKIWDENPDGDRVVDWNAMLNNLNWDLNFA